MKELTLSEAIDRIEEALVTATNLGSFDGAHHKQYAIDQIVRVLTGCPSVRKVGTQNGVPYAYTVLGESEEYLAWIRNYCADEDGHDTYEWDEGIAP